MKVFDEFWQKFRKELEGDYSIDDVFFAKRIWKASLEWVLQEGGCDPGCGYRDIIKEELEDA